MLYFNSNLGATLTKASAFDRSVTARSIPQQRPGNSSPTSSPRWPSSIGGSFRNEPEQICQQPGREAAKGAGQVRLVAENYQAPSRPVYTVWLFAIFPQIRAAGSVELSESPPPTGL